MVDSEKRFLNIQDTIIDTVGLIDRVAYLDRQAAAALIDFRTAHLSYFQSQQVAAVIVQAIIDSARVSYATDALPHQAHQ